MTAAERVWAALEDDPDFMEGMWAVAKGAAFAKVRRHKAESGEVSGRNGTVLWRMTADEAEEIADYIERSSVKHDLARVDVKALRRAVKDARR
jgi:hypothetical protein